MNIGIVGLGLIGGSFAKAYKNTGATVLGTDKSSTVTEFAKMAGTIDEELDEVHFSKCDCIILAITPNEAINWLHCNAPRISANTAVIDCCGTKRLICETGFQLAKEYGFTFVGGHPMAGKQFGGIENSRADLFNKSTMVLVPEKCDDIFLLEKLKKLFTQAGFGNINITTAEEHDKIVAFTSQMTHLVSNAFVKSDTALMDNKSISAGSFRDFTRVAFLNEEMWTELFLDNKDNLKNELNVLIDELNNYKTALDAEDPNKLKELLKEGRQCKSEVEKKCG